MKYDLVGQRFGRLKVLNQDQNRKNKHDIYWICECDCGRMKSVTTGHLRTGTVKSCGCIKREQAVAQFKQAAVNNITHGEARTRLYSIWHLMKERCSNPNIRAYKWYGGKGVKVCEAWNEYANFAEWAYKSGYSDNADVKHADKLSIDRIDSDGDYCPENCRWITVRENTTRAAKARWEKTKRANRSAGTSKVI